MKTSAAPQAEPAAGTLWRCGGRDCGAGECEHEENELHRHASGPGPQYAPGIVHDVLRSPGTPLPEEVRDEMESRLGHDFADVRIHTDGRAGQSAQEVQAHAYTVGRDVVFAPGMFNPGSGEGQKLIAHELTHAASAPAGSVPRLGPLRVSSPDEPAEQHAARTSMSSAGCGSPVASQGLMRQSAPVDLTGISVNHARVTVPPEATLSLSATLTPSNAGPGVRLSITGTGGTTIDPGTTITNAGAITVAATQGGGMARVDGRQTYTPPGFGEVVVTAGSPEFRFVATPGGIASTTAAAAGVANRYGAKVRQTFSPATGSAAGLDLAHVQEQFANSTTATAGGTTITLTDPMFPSNLAVAVNNPTLTSGVGGGWDLDNTGKMRGDDVVTWTQDATARPFVRNASTPTPTSVLPHAVDVTQQFLNLSSPSGAYATTTASTIHRRMLAIRNGAIKAVTWALPGGVTAPEVEEAYVGPPAFWNCRANPASVAPSAPRRRGAPPANTSTVQVDRSGAARPATRFSIEGAALGCTVNATSGRVTIGDQAGTITVRAGETANYDETTIAIAAPTPVTTPGTPGSPTPGTPTPAIPTP